MNMAHTHTNSFFCLPLNDLFPSYSDCFSILTDRVQKDEGRLRWLIPDENLCYINDTTGCDLERFCCIIITRKWWQTSDVLCARTTSSTVPCSVTVETDCVDLALRVSKMGECLHQMLAIYIDNCK